MFLPLWLREHVEQDSVFGARSHQPLYSLVILIHEIGQLHTGKNFLLLEPPRSCTYYGEEGMYLFYVGVHRQIVSFGMNHQDIRSIGTRYRDPLDIKSGVDPIIQSGWMGVAKLIESAVRRSPYFGKLQTIETDAMLQPQHQSNFGDADETRTSTYDIWVTPRKTWTIPWQSRHVGNGSVTFRRGIPVRIARVTVDRPISFDHPDLITELVTDIQLYPDVRASMQEHTPFPDAPWKFDGVILDEEDWEDVYDEDGFWLGEQLVESAEKPKPPARPLPDTNPDRPLIYMSAADQGVLRLAPHSDFQLSWK